MLQALAPPCADRRCPRPRRFPRPPLCHPHLVPPQRAAAAPVLCPAPAGPGAAAAEPRPAAPGDAVTQLQAGTATPACPRARPAGHEQHGAPAAPTHRGAGLWGWGRSRPGPCLALGVGPRRGCKGLQLGAQRFRGCRGIRGVQLGAAGCRTMQGGAGGCSRVQWGAGGYGGCRGVQLGAGGCRGVQWGAGGCRWIQGGAGTSPSLGRTLPAHPPAVSLPTEMMAGMQTPLPGIHIWGGTAPTRCCLGCPRAPPCPQSQPCPPSPVLPHPQSAACPTAAPHTQPEHGVPGGHSHVPPAAVPARPARPAPGLGVPAAGQGHRL